MNGSADTPAAAAASTLYRSRREQLIQLAGANPVAARLLGQAFDAGISTAACVASTALLEAGRRADSNPADVLLDLTTRIAAINSAALVNLSIYRVLDNIHTGEAAE